MEKKSLQIAYIGGGSMMWAWDLMGDLALEPQLTGTVRLYDIDYQLAKDNEFIGNSLKDDPNAVGKWDYKAVDNLPETLKGADFVVISILPGTFDEMESDVHAPEKYGIYTSVGDTVGPAGVIRSMRTVPMYVEIAEAIKAHCPDAWVINYTNPMTVCTRTLYAVFPEIKAFGCCHEVFHTQQLMARMLDYKLGIKDVPRNDVHVNVMGINHFTWVDKASYRDIDLMPMFADFAREFAEKGFPLTETDADPNHHGRNLNKVCFDLMIKHGITPVAGDRHIAEFMPPWYLKDPETVFNWGFSLTKVERRKQRRERTSQRKARIIAGEEKFVPHSSGEESIRQFKAILGLSDPIVTNVNIPNRGQMTGLPLDAVLETNAVFSYNSVRPVFAGQLPKAVNTIVARHVANQEMLVEAGIRKDTDLAFAAFVNDNLVQLDFKDAQALFKEMTHNTAKYLDGWKL